MRSSRKRVVLQVLAALPLFGCLASPDFSDMPNVFSGSYTGTWASPSTNASGTTSVTVDREGRFTGATVDESTGAHGSLSGTLADSGSFNGQVSYPNSRPNRIAGTFAFIGEGRIGGDLIQRVDDRDVPLTVTLQPR